MVRWEAERWEKVATESRKSRRKGKGREGKEEESRGNRCYLQRQRIRKEPGSSIRNCFLASPLHSSPLRALPFPSSRLVPLLTVSSLSLTFQPLALAILKAAIATVKLPRH
eukprot:764837-Hanusia_phi.AAC.9